MLSKMTGLFLDAFKFHKVSLEDCMTARKAIEVSVLDSVLRNADESDIKSLRENIMKAKEKLRVNELHMRKTSTFTEFWRELQKTIPFV